MEYLQVVVLLSFIAVAEIRAPPSKRDLLCPPGFSCCTRRDKFCPPGKQAVCNPTGRPVCQDCPTNTFQPDSTRLGTRCRIKKNCNKLYMTTVHKHSGSRIKDNVCRCRHGYRMVPILDMCFPNR